MERLRLVDARKNGLEVLLTSVAAKPSLQCPPQGTESRERVAIKPHTLRLLIFRSFGHILMDFHNQVLRILAGPRLLVCTSHPIVRGHSEVIAFVEALRIRSKSDEADRVLSQ